MDSLSTQCAVRLEPGVHHLGGGGQVQAGGEEQQQLASSQKLHFGRNLFDVNPPYNQPCHRQGGTFSTLVCSALLPLAYKVNPDLVVLRCFLLISQSCPSFCISQSFVLGHFKLDLVNFTWFWAKECVTNTDLTQFSNRLVGSSAISSEDESFLVARSRWLISYNTNIWIFTFNCKLSIFHFFQPDLMMVSWFDQKYQTWYSGLQVHQYISQVHQIRTLANGSFILVMPTSGTYCHHTNQPTHTIIKHIWSSHISQFPVAKYFYSFIYQSCLNGSFVRKNNPIMQIWSF